MYGFFLARATVWLSSFYYIFYFGRISQLYKLGFIEWIIQPDEEISIRAMMYCLPVFTILDAFIILLESRYEEIVKALDIETFKTLTMWEVLSDKGVVNLALNIRDYVKKIYQHRDVDEFLALCAISSIAIIVFEFIVYFLVLNSIL
jgi:hypothetical protein